VYVDRHPPPQGAGIVGSVVPVLWTFGDILDDICLFRCHPLQPFSVKSSKIVTKYRLATLRGVIFPICLCSPHSRAYLQWRRADEDNVRYPRRVSLRILKSKVSMMRMPNDDGAIESKMGTNFFNILYVGI